MKKRKIFSISTIILLTAIFSSCSSTFSFKNVETPNNEIYIERGKSFQVSENNDVAISLHGKDVHEKNEATIVAGITNKSSVSNFEFIDSSFNIYSGNIDKDDWTLVNNWNANFYYNNALSEANSRAFFTALSGALDIFNSGYNRGVYKTTYYSNGVTLTTTYRSHSNIAIATMLASNDMRNVLDANEKTLSFLQSNLLYSTSIKPNDSYVGVLYFPVDNKNPDYKIVYSDDYNSDLNFYFNRSDRAEILNPYLDKSRVRNSLVVGVSPAVNKIDFTYYYSSPKLFGLYSGICFYNLAKNEDNLSENEYKGFGQNFGLTIKTVPYTWLLLGFEYSYGIQNVANSYLSDYYIPYIGPQVGLNFIVNDIDFSTKVTWLNDYKNQVVIDFGVGLAF